MLQVAGYNGRSAAGMELQCPIVQVVDDTARPCSSRAQCTLLLINVATRRALCTGDLTQWRAAGCWHLVWPCLKPPAAGAAVPACHQQLSDSCPRLPGSHCSHCCPPSTPAPAHPACQLAAAQMTLAAYSLSAWIRSVIRSRCCSHKRPTLRLISRQLPPAAAVVGID